MKQNSAPTAKQNPKQAQSPALDPKQNSAGITEVMGLSPTANFQQMGNGQPRPAHWLALQRTVGNRVTQSLMHQYYSAHQRGTKNRVQRQADEEATASENEEVETVALGGGSHIVMEGDSINSIAQATYGDVGYWRDIAEANPGKVAEDCTILIGTPLYLPVIEVPVSSQDTSTTGESATATESPATTPPGASDANNASGSSGDKQSVATCYPEFVHTIAESQPVGPYPVPGGALVGSLALEGEIKVSKDGTCDPWTIDNNAIGLEAKQKIQDLVSSINVQVDKDGASMSSSYGASWGKVTAGMSAQGASASVSGDYGKVSTGVTSAGHVTFAFQPKEMSAKIGDHKLQFTLGAKLELSFYPKAKPYIDPTYGPESGIPGLDSVLDRIDLATLEEHGDFIGAGIAIAVAATAAATVVLVRSGAAAPVAAGASAVITYVEATERIPALPD